jgi:lactate dehydrogenase-like 2-hydroxyacid dehydrogenase
LAAKDILVVGELPAKTEKTLAAAFAARRVAAGASAAPALDETGATIRGIARGGHFAIDGALIDRLPKLEIIASFGVGYDGIDLERAAGRGIIVTNTPDVLTEEVADTALGLLLMTVRELSAAERWLRAGRWARDGNYRLTPATLRNRTVGIVGLGRIGAAIARRLDAMQVPVAYHNRHRRDDVAYPYHASVRDLATAVDILVVVLPGTAATGNIVDATVLRALGADGILINIGRGSAVDEPALIAALRDGVILAAGLDVFAHEPDVPPELMALPNAVLLPHLGSASVFTRDAMGQLVVDNLRSWFEDGRPLTPVAETPWPRQ